MATAVVQHKLGQQGFGTSLTVTLAASATAGNHLATLVPVHSANTTISTPTSSPTTTWTLYGSQHAETNSNSRFGCWYSENIASGTYAVTVTTGGTTDYGVGVYEASGVATSASKGQAETFAGLAASATVQPGSQTPTAGSLMYSFYRNALFSTTAATVDSSFTADGIYSASNGDAGWAFLANAAASAVNPTWTAPSSTGVGAAMYEFLAAAGGGAFDPSTVPWPSADVLPQPYALAGF